MYSKSNYREWAYLKEKKNKKRSSKQIHSVQNIPLTLHSVRTPNGVLCRDSLHSLQTTICKVLT